MTTTSQLSARSPASARRQGEDSQQEEEHFPASKQSYDVEVQDGMYTVSIEDGVWTATPVATSSRRGKLSCGRLAKLAVGLAIAGASLLGLLLEPLNSATRSAATGETRARDPELFVQELLAVVDTQPVQKKDEDLEQSQDALPFRADGPKSTHSAELEQTQENVEVAEAQSGALLIQDGNVGVDNSKTPTPIELPETVAKPDVRVHDVPEDGTSPFSDMVSDVVLVKSDDSETNNVTEFAQAQEKIEHEIPVKTDDSETNNISELVLQAQEKNESEVPVTTDDLETNNFTELAQGQEEIESEVPVKSDDLQTINFTKLAQGQEKNDSEVLPDSPPVTQEVLETDRAEIAGSNDDLQGVTGFEVLPDATQTPTMLHHDSPQDRARAVQALLQAKHEQLAAAQAVADQARIQQKAQVAAEVAAAAKLAVAKQKALGKAALELQKAAKASKEAAAGRRKAKVKHNGRVSKRRSGSQRRGVLDEPERRKGRGSKHRGGREDSKRRTGRGDADSHRRKKRGKKSGDGGSEF